MCQDKSNSSGVRRTLPSPLHRSTHRHSSHNLAAMSNNSGSGFANNGPSSLHYSHSMHSKRSQSPYSTTNKAYLSPPPPDGHWRRTNSDSALHQSALNSNASNQQSPNFQVNNCNDNGLTFVSSPQRTSAMMIDNSNNFALTGESGQIDWTDFKNDSNDKFLLSASLPDQQLRPHSCEVPGINIYPSQDEGTNPDSNHHSIPISSNTGSLPDLTNLHYPVPLNSPADTDDPNKMTMNATNPNSPYSNGPDSPYSPTSSHNSNLSPPPPSLTGNYAGNSPSSCNTSPRRQTSPGPCQSPTMTRRPHHIVNNRVLGNHQSSPAHHSQVCYPRHSPPNHIPPAPNPDYLNQTSPSNYKSLPRITVEVTLGPVVNLCRLSTLFTNHFRALANPLPIELTAFHLISLPNLSLTGD